VRILHSIAELSELPGPLVLAVGVFDGVHLGHRAVIQRALADARATGGTAVVVTFDPHPARVLRPEQSPLLLTCIQHKQQLISALGVENLLIVPFDKTVAAMEPSEFIREIATAAKPLRQICVGENWSFGKGRTGNIHLLKTLGENMGFAAIGIPDVQMNERPVSSTAIRNAVQAGDITTAAKLLGRNFSILGTVVAGRKMGRTIGFPTANLATNNEQLPPNGVYAVTMQLRGKHLPGVANVGVRPTLEDAGARVCEVHLFDYTGDFYGEEVEVSFLRFIREERKFQTLDALRDQISQDVTAAKLTTS
jgi:riboflavin kinase/FMN adenylyltransferase